MNCPICKSKLIESRVESGMAESYFCHLNHYCRIQFGNSTRFSVMSESWNFTGCSIYRGTNLGDMSNYTVFNISGVVCSKTNIDLPDFSSGEEVINYLILE